MRLCLYMYRVCTMLVLTCCCWWFVSYNNTQDDCCSRPCNVKVLIIYIYVVVCRVYLFLVHIHAQLYEGKVHLTRTHIASIFVNVHEQTNKQ